MAIFADVQYCTIVILTYWVGGSEKVQKYADVIQGRFLDQIPTFISPYFTSDSRGGPSRPNPPRPPVFRSSTRLSDLCWSARAHRYAAMEPLPRIFAVWTDKDLPKMRPNLGEPRSLRYVSQNLAQEHTTIANLEKNRTSNPFLFFKLFTGFYNEFRMSYQIIIMKYKSKQDTVD